MGDHRLSGVLPVLSVIVILGAGECSCLGPGGGQSELQDLDLNREVCVIPSMSLDGGLDSRPDLVLTSNVSSSSGIEAIGSVVLCTSYRSVHTVSVGYSYS